MAQRPVTSSTTSPTSSAIKSAAHSHTMNRRNTENSSVTASVHPPTAPTDILNEINTLCKRSTVVTDRTNTAHLPGAPVVGSECPIAPIPLPISPTAIVNAEAVPHTPTPQDLERLHNQASFIDQQRREQEQQALNNQKILAEQALEIQRQRQALLNAAEQGANAGENYKRLLAHNSDVEKRYKRFKNKICKERKKAHIKELKLIASSVTSAHGAEAVQDGSAIEPSDASLTGGSSASSSAGGSGNIIYCHNNYSSGGNEFSKVKGKGKGKQGGSYFGKGKGKGKGYGGWNTRWNQRGAVWW